MSDGVSGRELLAAIKAGAGAPGPGFLIPVGSPLEAALRPIPTSEELLNAKDVQVLTDWRNRFASAFLNEFQATPSQTARWLVDVVRINPGKILFMADDLNGNTWGYMGLDFIDWAQGYGEADAIVRGGEAIPGRTKHALKALLAWATGQLGLRELGVRVRSDNPAVEFYRKSGFSEIRRVPLRRVAESAGARWIEDPWLQAATVHLVHMRWRRET